MSEVQRLKPRGEVLIKEITKAYKHVTREGGVSWSEADVIDDYGSMGERLVARARDKDRSWQDLINGSTWDPRVGGRYSFLDATGFRYYLPPAMIRAIRSGFDAGIQNHLINIQRPGADWREFASGIWGRFDHPQLRCVASFLQFMIALCDARGRDAPDEELGWKHEARGWRDAFELGWASLP